jgi:hypothetical protein
MAFNPFHRFRKHQKVIFAVLTILIMFVFVLSTGTRGDFFNDILPRFFGGKGTKGPLVATVYGTKVYDKDLKLEQEREQVANLLVRDLQRSVLLAARNAKTGKEDAKLGQLVDRILQRAGGFGGGNRPVDLDLVEVRQLKDALKDKPGKDQERKALDEVEAALKIQGRPALLDSAYLNLDTKLRDLVVVNYSVPLLNPRQELRVFGRWGTPEELLDFMIWKHQADKLGIVLEDSDVRKLLQRDTGGLDLLPEGDFRSNKDFRSRLSPDLTTLLDANKNFTEKEILDALRQEYRVQLAQEALLGEAKTTPVALVASDQGLRVLETVPSRDASDPVPTTPGDFLTYLREQRTAVKVAVLPVPVAAFEDQVKDEPTESGLRELFEKYRKEEPAPDRPQPAFKQPRRVRIEYVIASPDSDFYKEAGKNRLAMSAAEPVLAGLQPSAGGPDVGALTGLGAVWRNPAQKAYSDYLKEMRRFIEKGAFVGPEQKDRSYAAAAGLGSVLAGLAEGNPWTAPGTVIGMETKRQQNDARAAAATVGGAAGVNPLGQPALPLPFTASVEPRSKVEPALLRQSERVEAQAMVVRNLKTFEQELKKRATKPEEARAYIEKAAKEYGLEHKTMTVARDQYGLIDDPELAVFKKDQEEKPDEPVTAAGRKAFATPFLQSTGVYKPVFWSAEGGDLERLFTQAEEEVRRAPSSAQEVEEIKASRLARWSQSRQPVLFWRAEDNPARDDRPFKDVREDVLKAWKHQRARALARQAAKRLEAEAKQHKWPTDAAARETEVKAWLNDQKLGQTFVLDNVARQVLEPQPAGADKDKDMDKKSYRPYTVPEKDVPYAPAKFVDQLLRLEQPGEATYVTDQPENTFYVAVLLVRTPPSNKEFEDALAHPSADPLWEKCVLNQRNEFREAFLAKLREEAAPKEVENGKWNLPEEVRKRSRREE